MKTRFLGFTFGMIVLASYFLIQYRAVVSASRTVSLPELNETDTRIYQLGDGVTYEFTLTNAGKPGYVQVTAICDCSDGQWSRSQTLHFGIGETRRLRYAFSEPPRTAANIQCCLKMDLEPD